MTLIEFKKNSLFGNPNVLPKSESHSTIGLNNTRYVQHYDSVPGIPGGYVQAYVCTVCPLLIVDETNLIY